MLKETPRDKDNHALDALRYALMYSDAGPRLDVRVTSVGSVRHRLTLADLGAYNDDD
jgi:hypothetical protein